METFNAVPSWLDSLRPRTGAARDHVALPAPLHGVHGRGRALEARARARLHGPTPPEKSQLLEMKDLRDLKDLTIHDVQPGDVQVHQADVAPGRCVGLGNS